MVTLILNLFSIQDNTFQVSTYEVSLDLTPETCTLILASPGPQLKKLILPAFIKEYQENCPGYDWEEFFNRIHFERTDTYTLILVQPGTHFNNVMIKRGSDHTIWVPYLQEVNLDPNILEN